MTEANAPAYVKHRYCLLVTVKEGSSSFIDNVFGYLRFRMYINFKKIPFQQEIKLPEGSWQLIGLGSELTEEQKKEIVHEQNRMCGGKYFDYKKKANVANSSDESFASLLHSHNLNPDTTVILKQIEV